MCKIPVFVFKEADMFVAYTPALDLTSCGETFEKAKENFSEALELFMDAVIKMGTLETVLEECGWKKIHLSKTRRHGLKPRWAPPVIVGQFDTEVALPN